MTNCRFTLVLACVVVFSCVFLVGCGPKGPPRADVNGSVAWQGKPVTTGIITLYSKSTGQGSSTEIAADGTFKLLNVIVGSYQVSVAPPVLAIPNEGEAPKPVPPFPVPAKYHEDQTSGLTFEVKSETANTLTLDLK